MSEINWTIPREDHVLIRQIVERGVTLYAGDRKTLAMDIIATHANGCPLDLEGLLAADEADFIHDLAGICAHIDRETGRLRDCFVPRLHARDDIARGEAVAP